MSSPTTLDHLRAAVARIERGGTETPAGCLPFGIEAIDDTLPGGGLPTAALHEVVGHGIDAQYAAAPALFAAGILARLHGPVLWVMERGDLFAPGLAAAGLPPGRVIYAEAPRSAVLIAMEEGLRHPGMAGVVAEVSARISLSASRRLQLAAQAGGAVGMLLRRGDGVDAAMAAVTRWRIGPCPSGPPIPHAADTPGLGRQRWRLELTRCRSGRTGAWVVEACDASGRLGMVPLLGDGSAQADPRQAAG